MPSLERCIDFLARHCKLLAGLGLLSAILPALFLARLSIDNSIEVWLARNNSAFATYQEFLQRYGSDEFIVVAVETNAPFSEEALQRQSALAQRLRAIDGVERVWDLPSLAHALWGSRENWPDAARQNAFLRNMILAPDGSSVGLFIWLKSLQGAEKRRAYVAQIEAAVADSAGPDFRPHLAGAPLLNVALDRASMRDSMLFLPLAIGVCIVLLALMLRNVSGVVAAMCAVGVSALWTMGLMGMLGRTLNIVTVVMPTLHFVVGLANGIRLTSRYFDHLSSTRDQIEAVRRTLRECLLPLLFMALTTAVGFASLIGSELEPIADLGLFSGIGILIAFVCAIMIVPGLLCLLQGTTLPATRPRAPHWSGRTGRLMAGKRWMGVGIALASLMLCALTLPRIRTESNVLKFFPADSQIVRDYEFIGAHLTGFYTIELDVRGKESSGYGVSDGFKRIDRQLQEQPGVVRIDYLGKDAQLEALASDSADSPLAGLAERFYWEGGTDAGFRLCVLVNTMASNDFYPLIASLKASAEKNLPKDVRWNVTGVVSLLNDAQAELVRTQIGSFSMAFGIDILMIGVLFLSLRAALASILPNLLPIGCTFAFMALRSVPLDAATVMTASVAIGIAVDNTIFFLARFRAERRSSRTQEDAVEETFHQIGSSVVFSSIVAAAGFAILGFAGFQPIAYFGLLTAATMLTSLAGALFLTPACTLACKFSERA